MDLARSLRFGIVILGTFCLTACPSNDGPHQAVVHKDAKASGESFEKILPILQSRCVRCHSSGTNDWSKESNLRPRAESGLLALRLSNKSMPQVGSPESQAITQGERDAIIAWANSVGKAPSAPTASAPPEDRRFALLSQCIGCHGLNGNSVAPEIPNLASHSREYILKRLSAFLLPNQVGTMPGLLPSILTSSHLGYKLSASGEEELAPETQDLFAFLADYFSNQRVQPGVDEFVKRQKALTDDQKKLFENGKKILSEQCIACHLGADGLPAGPFPMIFGQKAKYLEARLKEFREGRGGDTMPGIASGLTDDDVNSIVVFLSNEHPVQMFVPSSP